MNRVLAFLLVFLCMDVWGIPPAVRARTRSKAVQQEARKIALEREIQIAVSELIAEANALYNRREFYRSLQVVERVLTMAPFLTRGWLMKGSLLYVQGHRDLAQQSWQRARELDPDSKEAAYALEIYR